MQAMFKVTLSCKQAEPWESVLRKGRALSESVLSDVCPGETQKDFPDFRHVLDTISRQKNFSTMFPTYKNENLYDREGKNLSIKSGFYIGPAETNVRGKAFSIHVNTDDVKVKDPIIAVVSRLERTLAALCASKNISRPETHRFLADNLYPYPKSWVSFDVVLFEHSVLVTLISGFKISGWKEHCLRRLGLPYCLTGWMDLPSPGDAGFRLRPSERDLFRDIGAGGFPSDPARWSMNHWGKLAISTLEKINREAR